MIDLLADLAELRLQRLRIDFRLRQLPVPEVREHLPRDLVHAGARLDALQKRHELALDLVAADRLPVARAASLRAEVVGVAADRSLRPAGRKRAPAVIADNVAAQREVFAVVLLARRVHAAAEAILDALVGLKADDRLMLAWAQPDAPARHLNVPGVDRLCQHRADCLVTDDPALVLGEMRLILQEAHHLGLRLEAAMGVAFERLLDDRGDRLFRLENFAGTKAASVAVANRRLEDPVAVHRARPHEILSLLCVLLAMMMRYAGDDVLQQLRVRVRAEVHGRQLQDATRHFDLQAEAEIVVKLAREAVEVVDDDDGAARAARAQIGKYALQDRAVVATAAHLFMVDGDDVVALILGVVTASRLLAVEAIAALGLLRVRNPAVDDRFIMRKFTHSGCFPSSGFSDAA